MSFLHQISAYDQIKSLWENRIRETLNLEYKAELSGNNDEVAKDISAMANSDGGVIFYGISEDTSSGVAIPSQGMDLGKKAEKIQQIVSSSVAPELQIIISVIESVDASGNAIQNKGFIIVKVPKSELFIHQVTTTGRYYIRNNTTTKTHVYEPQELKESDIALRYEKRFENKRRLEQSSVDKEKQLLIEKSDPTRYLFLSCTSAAPILSIKVNAKLFNRMLFKKEEGSSLTTPSDLLYDTMSNDHMFFNNKPTQNGRIGQNKNGSMLIEMTNNGSIYFFSVPSQEREWPWAVIFWAVIDLMHMSKRFYSDADVHHYGGSVIRLSFRNDFPATGNGDIVPHLDKASLDIAPATSGAKRITKNIRIDRYMQFASAFDVQKTFFEIFDNVFESIGIDGAETRYPQFVKALTDYIKKLG